MKEVGEYQNFIGCTSRGSGKNVQEIEPKGHEPCPECIPWPVQKRVGIWKELYDNDVLLAKGKYVVFDYIGLPNEKHGLWKFYDKKQRLKKLVYFNKGAIVKKVIPNKLKECVNYKEIKAWYEFRKPEKIDIHDFFILEAIRTQNIELYGDLEKNSLVDSESLKFLEDQGLLLRQEDSINLNSMNVSEDYLKNYHFLDQFLPGSHLHEVLSDFEFSPYMSTSILDGFEKYAESIDFRIDKHGWIVYLISALKQQNIAFNTNFLFWTQFERITESFELWKSFIPDLLSFEEFQSIPTEIGLKSDSNEYYLRNEAADFQIKLTNNRTHHIFEKTYDHYTKSFRRIEEYQELENFKEAYDKNVIALKYNSIIGVCKETGSSYTWSALTDYYSTNKITRQTPEFARENRRIILEELKRGKSAEYMGRILYRAIQNSPDGELKHALKEQPIVLPIPASSIEKNDKRFKPLIASFCKYANAENGYHLAIPAEEGRKAQHLSEESIHLSSYITIDQGVKDRVVLVIDDVRSQGRSTRAMQKKLINQGARAVHFVYFGLSVNNANRFYKEEFDDRINTYNFKSFHKAYFKTSRNEYYCGLNIRSTKGNFMYRRHAYIKARELGHISKIESNAILELNRWELERDGEIQTRFFANFLNVDENGFRVFFSELEFKNGSFYSECYLVQATKFEGVENVIPLFQKANLMLPKNSIIQLTWSDE